MGDWNDGRQPDSAAAATRRPTRPAPRRRFYDNVATAAAAGGHAVQLDGKPIRTPAGRILAVPTATLARALAAEWDAQRDLIDPARMPLTRLANSIIDGVSDQPDQVAAEVEKYLASDLVCYRAAAPSGLVERQARHWDPILAWARETLAAPLRAAAGVVHIAQDEDALARARAAIHRDPCKRKPAEHDLFFEMRPLVQHSSGLVRKVFNNANGPSSRGCGIGAGGRKPDAVMECMATTSKNKRTQLFPPKCCSGVNPRHPLPNCRRLLVYNTYSFRLRCEIAQE